MPAPIIPSSADAPAWLVVSIDWVHGAVVLRGELDRDSAHHLVDAAAALSATSHPSWVIDTAAVTWCDAAGLRALATVHAVAVAHGRRLRLVRSSRCVDRLVTVSGLAQLIADRTTPAPAAPRAAPSPGTARTPSRVHRWPGASAAG